MVNSYRKLFAGTDGEVPNKLEQVGEGSSMPVVVSTSLLLLCLLISNMTWYWYYAAAAWSAHS